MVHHIEGSKLTEEISKSTKELVIVDFFATWCMPCQMASPILDKLSSKNDERIDIFKINIDESQDIAIRYGVVSVPTFIFFKNNIEIERQVGLIEEREFQNLINSLL